MRRFMFSFYRLFIVVIFYAVIGKSFPIAVFFYVIFFLSLLSFIFVLLLGKFPIVAVSSGPSPSVD